MITVTGLDDFATSLAVLSCGDAGGHTALAVVHGGTSGTAEIAHATAYLVDAAGQATYIGTSEPGGKDMGVALEREGTTLRMWVAEALPGGGGATGRVDRYDFPNSIPAAMVVSGVQDNVVRSCLRALRTAVATALAPLG